MWWDLFVVQGSSTYCLFQSQWAGNASCCFLTEKVKVLYLFVVESFLLSKAKIRKLLKNTSSLLLGRKKGIESVWKWWEYTRRPTLANHYKYPYSKFMGEWFCPIHLALFPKFSCLTKNAYEIFFAHYSRAGLSPLSDVLFWLPPIKSSEMSLPAGLRQISHSKYWW